MIARLARHVSRTSPGGTVTYSIWIWSTVAARRVTASATSNAHAMRSPRFTLCPAAHRTRCSIGDLPANQAFELMVTDRVRATAKIGAPINLAVTVSAATLSPAEASVSSVVSRPGPAPTSAPVPGPPLAPSNLAPIPGATITPSSLSSLFPVVTPQATPSSKPTRSHKLAGVTQTSSALPLDRRLIGGQLAGLAVLAAAITMVVARLSLRTPQVSGPADAAPPAAAGKDGKADGEQPAS